MQLSGKSSKLDMAARFAADVVHGLAAANDEDTLKQLMADITRDMGFQYYAMITHEDHRVYRPGQVDIRAYPDAISERIIGQGQFRRDPVMRGCIFADSAFLWSKLDELIEMNCRDKAMLEYGVKNGLSEGITVPVSKLGYHLGSTTFAGAASTERAEYLLGIVEMVGVLAFKRARELAGVPIIKGPRPRLNPRPQDCLALIARGKSNKEIARALDLTPRTVEGYLRDAFQLFSASTRAELLAGAMLAGEIGTHQLR